MKFSSGHSALQILALFGGLIAICAAVPAHAKNGDGNSAIKMAEVQWTICADQALDFWQIANSLDGAKSKTWETYYMDDANLSLFKQKGVLRFRELPSGEFRTSLKRNYTVSEFEKAPKGDLVGGESELDVYGESRKVGWSVTHKGDVRGAALSELQRSVLKDRFGLAVSSLKRYGPAKTHRVSFKADGVPTKSDFNFEVMFDRGGRVYAELSVRAELDDVESVQRKVNRLLESYNMKTCPSKESKTKAIIDSFRAKDVSYRCPDLLLGPI